MIRTVCRRMCRRVVTVLAAASVLTGAGVTLAAGPAFAAGVTASPGSEPNSGSFSISFTGSSTTWLASSVTLTDHSNPSNSFSAAANGMLSQPSKTTATFNLLNKLPGVYDITVVMQFGQNQTCVSSSGSPCFTIVGLPPTLTLSPPGAIPAGGSADGSLQLVNPARGAKYNSPGVRFEMSGLAGLHASNLTLTMALGGSPQNVPLSDSGGSVIGIFGPSPTGIGPGATLGGVLHFTATSNAPHGALSIAVEFGEMTQAGAIPNPVASDSADTSVTAAPTGSTYHALTPVRVLDTRSNLGHTGALGPNGTLSLVVGGTHGIPTGATAVAINLLATGSNGSGFLVAYPSGSAPGASNVNYTRGSSTANLAVVPLDSATHGITIANGSSTTTVHVVADIDGYYDNSGASFTPLTPVRILDTRTGAGTPIAANSSRTLTVTGVGGVSSGASAAALNVTAVNGSRGGFVNVYPAGTTQPGTSTVDYNANQTVANLTLVPLSSDGKVVIANHSTGTVHVIVDVQGFFSSTTASSLHPMTITRVLDTRTGTALAGHTALTVTLGGKAGLPASGLTMAAVNITVTNPAGVGYLTAYPEGSSRPLASNVNFIVGQTVANLGYVRVSGTGGLTIYNGSSSSTHVIVDVEGWG